MEKDWILGPATRLPRIPDEACLHPPLAEPAVILREVVCAVHRLNPLEGTRIRNLKMLVQFRNSIFQSILGVPVFRKDRLRGSPLVIHDLMLPELLLLHYIYEEPSAINSVLNAHPFDM